MANKTYFWVGGHTGWTGQHSGYNQATGVWTNPFTGLTNGGNVGDISYGPYAWNNPNNWRLRFEITGSQPQRYQYYIPFENPRTPVGLDLAVFGFTAIGAPTLTAGGSPIVSGSLPQRGYVSCLFGGMSGDGFTASGSTAWANHGPTSSMEKYGPVGVYIGQQFVAFKHRQSVTPYFRTGEFGFINSLNNPYYQQGYTAGSSLINHSLETLNSDAPLRGYWDFVRVVTTAKTTGFQGSPSNTMANYWGLAYPENLTNYCAAGYTGPLCTQGNFVQDTGDPEDYAGRSGFLSYLKGKWDAVYHQNGSILLQDNFEAPYVEVAGRIENFASLNSVKVDRYQLTPLQVSAPGRITVEGNGSYTVSEVFVGGFPGQMGPLFPQVRLGGKYNTGGQDNGITGIPRFDTVTVGVGQNSITGPIVSLGNVRIDSLRVDKGIVQVDSSVGPSDKCIVRNGYVKAEGRVDMNHPYDTNWQKFFLGYDRILGIVGSDPGLRMDSSNAVLKCFAGQNLTTRPEAMTGP
jgi:hypothetical protein